MKVSDFSCPTCGADVSPNAQGCPECGARKVNGRWVEPETYDGLDLPEDEFDYNEFIECEFGDGVPRKKGKELFWWIVAIIVLIAFALLVIPF